MKIKKFNSILTMLFMALLMSACSSNEPGLILAEEISDNSVLPASETEAVRESSSVFVYVCGSVNNPGVYELDSESRLYEAVEMAGGFTNEADASSLNLAEPIVDGTRYYVPSMSESSLEAEKALLHYDEEGRLNINTADLQEIMTLPGIGESKGSAIIKYREENGNFSEIQDIMNVSGIGEGLFNDIEDLIVVY